MDFPHFVSIEQESTDGGRHYFVVHTHDPKLAVKFAAETTAEGKVKPGSIQQVSVPNSWAGEYSQYAKLLSKAEKFFRASLSKDPSLGGRLGNG